MTSGWLYRNGPEVENIGVAQRFSHGWLKTFVSLEYPHWTIMARKHWESSLRLVIHHANVWTLGNLTSSYGIRVEAILKTPYFQLHQNSKPLQVKAFSMCNDVCPHQ